MASCRLIASPVVVALLGTTMKLSIYYDTETDTLSLWNGQPSIYAAG